MTDIEVTFGMAKLLRHFLHQRDICQPVTYMSANVREGIGAATFYPNVTRLETEGWVTAEWEGSDGDDDRPSRRFYYLTVTGAALAQAAVERYRPGLWRLIGVTRRMTW